MRPLTPQEADLNETGPMFAIQLEDGSEQHAFGDELTPVEDTGKLVDTPQADQGASYVFQ